MGRGQGSGGLIDPNLIGLALGQAKCLPKPSLMAKRALFFLARVRPEWFGAESETRSNGPWVGLMGLLIVRPTFSPICGTASTVLLLVNLENEREGAEDIEHGIGFYVIILY